MDEKTNSRDTRDRERERTPVGGACLTGETRAQQPRGREGDLSSPLLAAAGELLLKQPPA